MKPAQRLKLERLIIENSDRIVNYHLAQSAFYKAACGKKLLESAQALRTCLDELTDQPDLRRRGDAKE